MTPTHPPSPSPEQLYETLRAKIETPEHIGRLLLLDLDSGDYEIDDSPDDLGLEASRRLQDRHPSARLHALRIGYRTAASFCGSLERAQN